MPVPMRPEGFSSPAQTIAMVTGDARPTAASGDSGFADAFQQHGASGPGNPTAENPTAESISGPAPGSGAGVGATRQMVPDANSDATGTDPFAGPATKQMHTQPTPTRSAVPPAHGRSLVLPMSASIDFDPVVGEIQPGPVAQPPDPPTDATGTRSPPLGQSKDAPQHRPRDTKAGPDAQIEFPVAVPQVPVPQVPASPNPPASVEQEIVVHSPQINGARAYHQVHRPLGDLQTDTPARAESAPTVSPPPRSGILDTAPAAKSTHPAPTADIHAPHVLPHPADSVQHDQVQHDHLVSDLTGVASHDAQAGLLPVAGPPPLSATIETATPAAGSPARAALQQFSSAAVYSPALASQPVQAARSTMPHQPVQQRPPEHTVGSMTEYAAIPQPRPRSGPSLVTATNLGLVRPDTTVSAPQQDATGIAPPSTLAQSASIEKKATTFSADFRLPSSAPMSQVPQVNGREPIAVPSTPRDSPETGTFRTQPGASAAQVGMTPPAAPAEISPPLSTIARRAAVDTDTAAGPPGSSGRLSASVTNSAPTPAAAIAPGTDTIRAKPGDTVAPQPPDSDLAAARQTAAAVSAPGLSIEEPTPPKTTPVPVFMDPKRDPLIDDKGSLDTVGPISLFAPDTLVGGAARAVGAPGYGVADRPDPAAFRLMAEALHHTHDGRLELSLNPRELGKLHMTLHPGDTGINVTIHAERNETMDLLRRNIDLLGQEFRDLGYRDVRFDFGQGNQRSGQNPSATPQQTTPDPTAPNVSPPTLMAAAAHGGLDIRI